MSKKQSFGQLLEGKGNIKKAITLGGLDVMMASSLGSGLGAISGKHALVIGTALTMASHYFDDKFGIMRMAGIGAVVYGMSKSKEYRNDKNYDTSTKRLNNMGNDWLGMFYNRWKDTINEEKETKSKKESENKSSVTIERVQPKTEEMKKEKTKSQKAKKQKMKKKQKKGKSTLDAVQKESSVSLDDSLKENEGMEEAFKELDEHEASIANMPHDFINQILKENPTSSDPNQTMRNKVLQCCLLIDQSELEEDEIMAKVGITEQEFSDFVMDHGKRNGIEDPEKMLEDIFRISIEETMKSAKRTSQ